MAASSLTGYAIGLVGLAFGLEIRRRGSLVAGRAAPSSLTGRSPGREPAPPPVNPQDDVVRILYSEEEIRRGLGRVAGEVARAFGAEPFTVVSVLKGSCVFVADLIRCLPCPLELAFAAASSYRDGTRAQELRLLLFPDEREVEGRRLLLVDDILDTGQTLAALSSELYSRGATEVRSCVFLDKPSRRSVVFEPDFRCFEVEDVFVVGYGLDFRGRYRNLPFVGELRPEVAAGGSA